MSDSPSASRTLHKTTGLRSRTSCPIRPSSTGGSPLSVHQILNGQCYRRIMVCRTTAFKHSQPTIPPQLLFSLKPIKCLNEPTEQMSSHLANPRHLMKPGDFRITPPQFFHQVLRPGTVQLLKKIWRPALTADHQVEMGYMVLCAFVECYDTVGV